MNNIDHDSNVCSKDSYGNVTADKQDGNDIRNEKQYKGYTIDDGGGSIIVWNPDDSFFGRFFDVTDAKAVINEALKTK